MKNLFTIIFLVITIHLVFSASIYSKNYQSGATGYIGGITLFDDASPFVGLNNPALLIDYGIIPMDPEKITVTPGFSYSGFAEQEASSANILDAAIDPSAYEPRYSFGRLFLPSVYIGVAITEESLSGIGSILDVYKIIEPSGLGSDSIIQNIPLINSIDIAKLTRILTLGFVDISSLYVSNAVTNQEMDTAALVSNTLEVLKKYNGIGIRNFFNVNLLSYYRNRFGVSVYASGELTVGLYSKNRTLLVVNDPTLNMNFELGLAYSMGISKDVNPLQKYFNLGFNARVMYIVQAKTTSLEDFIIVYPQILNFIDNMPSESNVITQIDYIKELSAFSNGNLIKGGYGFSIDVSLFKQINKNISIAAKLSDIIAPRYWLSSKKLGWELPDLSVGLKYEFTLLEKFWMLINKPTFYIQINDLLYTHPVSLLSKIHLGIESRFLFDILQIGAGINQGYPTLGFALHITPMILSKIPIVKYVAYAIAPVTFFHFKYYLAIYGEELGVYPGDYGFMGYNTGIELYFGI